MRKPDTRDLAQLPNTLQWLKDNIKGFAEYHDGIQALQAEARARRAKLLPTDQPPDRSSK